MAKKDSGLGTDFYEVYFNNMLESSGVAENIRISDIEPRHDQPRKTFDKESLEVLADSIAAYGVLQPIIVRRSGIADGTYEIIAGERRWRASKMAGLTEIPAVIFEGDELKAAQVAIIENVQREDLNPVEEAMSYNALIEKFGLTQEQVAKQVGKSRPAITNMLRLLDLPPEVLELLRSGELSAGHARALLALKNRDLLPECAKTVIEKGLSVREAEAMAQRLNNITFDDTEERVHPQIKAHMKELEHRAMSVLGRKVRISRSSHKKVLELSYSDDEDLEALLKSLCGDKIFSEITE